MRFFIIGLVFSCLTSACAQKKEYAPLQLKSAHQLFKPDTLAFDFSGIFQSEEGIYLVADKPWNAQVYSLIQEADQWIIAEKFPLTTSDNLDLEAIDFCDNTYYLANENIGTLCKVLKDSIALVPISIDYQSAQLAPDTWENAGWEGLAVDCKNQIMYAVKERSPRFIVTIDMSTWTIIDQFNIPETESDDFSDAKFENGALYLLERNGNYITKINPATHEVIQKYHYRHVASNTQGKLFAPEKYGMAEALLLTDNEIWIGLDNNGKKVTDYAKKTFQFEGNAPVILRFERPEGF